MECLCPSVSAGARKQPSSAQPAARAMPAMPSKLQRLSSALSAQLASKSYLLPSPQQWSKWHANVKTPERANGEVATKAFACTLTISLTSDF